MARTHRHKECYFCKKNVTPDYKDVSTLERYVTSWSKMKSMRDTGACARHQRAVSTSIKRARILALLPFTSR